MTINWPFAFVLFGMFAIGNLRGIILLLRGYRPAAFGLVSLWCLAAMFLYLLRERMEGRL